MLLWQLWNCLWMPTLSCHACVMCHNNKMCFESSVKPKWCVLENIHCSKSIEFWMCVEVVLFSLDWICIGHWAGIMRYCLCFVLLKFACTTIHLGIFTLKNNSWNPFEKKFYSHFKYSNLVFIIVLPVVTGSTDVLFDYLAQWVFFTLRIVTWIVGCVRGRQTLIPVLMFIGYNALFTQFQQILFLGLANWQFILIRFLKKNFQRPSRMFDAYNFFEFICVIIAI